MKKSAGFLSAAFLGMLALAGAASADVVTVPLSDFVIFSYGTDTPDNTPPGNPETKLGGHTEVTGNIGSNQDLYLNGGPLPGYPAQINGSVYVGGFFLAGQYTVGTSLDPQEIVVNGATDNGEPANNFEADLGGLLYGNMYVTSEENPGDVVRLSTGILTDTPSRGVVGNIQINGEAVADSCVNCDSTRVSGTVTNADPTRTFQLITMPAETDLTGFIVTKGDQTIPGNPGTLTLVPNTLTTAYGDVEADNQDEILNLSSGEYYMNSLTAAGGFKLQIDLSSGNPINIYVLNDMVLGGSDVSLWVKGAGTGGAFLNINDPSAQALAALIYMETQGNFTKGGETTPDTSTWGGTLYASSRDSGEGNITIGQWIDWFGAAWAFDTFITADHGTWNLVPLDGEVPIPEPATMLLLGTGLVGVAGAARRRKKKNQA